MTTTPVLDTNPRIDCFLIGAPGAGKTELAKLFAKESKEWFESKGMKPLVVLDGLPQALAEDAGVQLGVNGTHFDSSAIWYHGEIRRDRTRKSGRSFLDTQSLVTTLAHINARLNVMGTLVQTPQLQAEMQREFMSGTVLTGYLPDRFALNFGWYIPLPEQIIVPGRDIERFPVAVDAVIRDMNLKVGLGLPVLEGTRDEQVQSMMDDLERYYDIDPTQAQDTEAVL